MEKLDVAQKGVDKWTKVKGVRDVSTGEFFPYPFPFGNFDIWGDDGFEVTVSLENDDPTAWSNPDAPHPVVEFKLRCFLPGDSDPGVLLLRRAKQLGIQLEKLPLASSLYETSKEERAVTAAKIAIRKAMWFPVLRWANLKEVPEPNGLRVPARVPIAPAGRRGEVGESQDTWEAFVERIYPDGFAPVNAAVADDHLRERARENLQGAELDAFNAYCELWDAHRLDW